MASKIQKRKRVQESLTLEGLADYTQEVLLPAMDERFVSKKDFNNFKDEMKEFKDETLTNFDSVLKKLDTLLTEKKVREYQEVKEKKLFAIIIKALKEHQILSTKELEEITKLEIF